MKLRSGWLARTAVVAVTIALLSPGIWAGDKRVSGNEQQKKLVHMVPPPYPEEAKKAGIEGVVRLEATINEEGAVAEVRLLSGPAELVKVAVDAVKQWRYDPTVVDGKAVAVITEINVNFKLKHPPEKK